MAGVARKRERHNAATLPAQPGHEGVTDEANSELYRGKHTGRETRVCTHQILPGGTDEYVE